MRGAFFASRVGLLLILGIGSVVADELPIDKIYLPYVNPLEKEIEFRAVDVGRGESGRADGSIRSLSFGAAVTERLALEAYLIDEPGGKDVDAYELEARFQITEQGEYSADWGVLLEYERERASNGSELGATLLVSRQWGRVQGTANLGLLYEKPEDRPGEIESRLGLQWKYLYHPHFEPGFEFYAGESYRGVGPAAQGTIRFANASSIHWELAGILGLDENSEQSVIRFALEYEFY